MVDQAGSSQGVASAVLHHPAHRHPARLATHPAPSGPLDRQLGGFLARAADGEPGPLTLWHGFQRLADHPAMYCVMRPLPHSNAVGKG